MLAAAFFGLLLGVGHALEADHIVAVTAIVSRGRGLLRSAMAGLSWGMGHTITLFAVGFGVLVLKVNFPETVALSMEFAVGVMLVVLGVPLIKQLVSRAHLHGHRHGDRWHIHPHSHGAAESHQHRHIGGSLLVGMVHGLAGSGALTLLVLTTMASVSEGLLFLLLFGIGSILAMLVVSGLLGLSFGLAAGLSRRLAPWLQGTVGLASVAFGVYIMWRVGFTEGLFSLVM